MAPGPGGGSLRRIPCCRCNVRLPTYATLPDMREPNCRSNEKFHCWVYCCLMCIRLAVTAGVSQELATRPTGQGWPGFGLGVAMGWPWKKLAKVRVGDAGGRSLKTVTLSTNGTVTTVLFNRFVSGKV